MNFLPRLPWQLALPLHHKLRQVSRPPSRKARPSSHWTRRFSWPVTSLGALNGQGIREQRAGLPIRAAAPRMSAAEAPRPRIDGQSATGFLAGHLLVAGFLPKSEHHCCRPDQPAFFHETSECVTAFPAPAASPLAREVNPSGARTEPWCQSPASALRRVALVRHLGRQSSRRSDYRLGRAHAREGRDHHIRMQDRTIPA